MHLLFHWLDKVLIFASGQTKVVFFTFSFWRFFLNCLSQSSPAMSNSFFRASNRSFCFLSKEKDDERFPFPFTSCLPVPKSVLAIGDWKDLFFSLRTFSRNWRTAAVLDSWGWNINLIHNVVLLQGKLTSKETFCRETLVPFLYGGLVDTLAKEKLTKGVSNCPFESGIIRGQWPMVVVVTNFNSTVMRAKIEVTDGTFATTMSRWCFSSKEEEVTGAILIRSFCPDTSRPEIAQTATAIDLGGDEKLDWRQPSTIYQQLLSPGAGKSLAVAPTTGKSFVEIKSEEGGDDQWISSEESNFKAKQIYTLPHTYSSEIKIQF